MWINVGLYGTDMLFSFKAAQVLNERNKKGISQLNLMFFFGYCAWGIYGLTVIYSQDATKLNILSSFYLLVWLRMLPSLCFGCFCLCICSMICCACIANGQDMMQQTQDQLSRLPGINNFVQQ